MHSAAPKVLSSTPNRISLIAGHGSTTASVTPESPGPHDVIGGSTLPQRDFRISPHKTSRHHRGWRFTTAKYTTAAHGHVATTIIREFTSRSHHQNPSGRRPVAWQSTATMNSIILRRGSASLSLIPCHRRNRFAFHPIIHYTIWTSEYKRNISPVQRAKHQNNYVPI